MKAALGCSSDGLWPCSWNQGHGLESVVALVEALCAAMSLLSFSFCASAFVARCVPKHGSIAFAIPKTSAVLSMADYAHACVTFVLSLAKT